MHLIGVEPLLSEVERSRYQSESNPITEDGLHVLPLERLLEIIADGQERIEAALEALDENQLQAKIQVGERMMPLGTRLYGFYFHDTYHTGQSELLRQVAGTKDKVV